jgi:hypothetical protein
MSNVLPKLDRDNLMEDLLAEAQRTVHEVADAVDNAPKGRVINDSEEPARVALDRFRSLVYERVLQAKVDAAEAAFPPPVSATLGHRKRHKGRQGYSVLTVNGRMALRRVRWHCPHDGSETPMDVVLDHAESTISEGVREMSCRVNQDASSFEKAAAILQRTAHLEVSKESLRRLVESEGKAVLQAMKKTALCPAWSAKDCESEQGPTRLYLGCDGVKVPLVTNEEKKKRRQSIRGKRQRGGRKCKPLDRKSVV